MAAPLRILHLEDDHCDVELVEKALRRSGLAFEIHTVSTQQQFQVALAAGLFDVILSDSSVPGFDGTNALSMARALNPRTPFVFLSGFANEEQARAKKRATGASDCVSKADLVRLADALASAVDRAGDEPAEATSDFYLRGMERLVGVVQELSLARSLPRIMEIVRSAARELTGADGATFVLRDGDLCHYADEEAIAPLWKGQRFEMTACISGWAMLNRQAAVVPDIYADPRVPADAYRPTFVKSLVMVPIRTAEPVGAIGNYWAERRQPRPEEVRLLQALADSTSVAMENVQLYSGLEQQVQDRTARLEAANEELEAFAYSVSHDLRAPLRHIAGYIDMLREEPESALSAQGQRYVGVVADSAARMSRLIDDLLEFSRMGRREMLRDPVEMATLVAEVMRELRHDTEGRSISWQIGELPKLIGDRMMLKQVWVNLLSNAVKYTGRKERAEIQVSAARSEGEWRFSVRDNGAGFDPAHAGRLFGVFQRLHAVREFDGTGIGLANVRRIVVRHGGRTWAEGRVGEGAVFGFSLPVVQ